MSGRTLATKLLVGLRTLDPAAMGKLAAAAKNNKAAMGKFAAAAQNIKAGEPPVLDWESQQETEVGQNSSDSRALAEGALASLAQTVVEVAPETLALVKAGNDSALRKALNDALLSESTKISIEEVKTIEQGLRSVPFTKYHEHAAVAVKKNIPIEKYEGAIKDKIGPRYNLPQKHIGELCDATFCELNQVSITDFAFQQEPPEGVPEDEVSNNFTFCRMVVFRREAAPKKEVLDLGYCFFNVEFKFGDEKVVRQIVNETTESVPRKFLWFTMGSDQRTVKTVKNLEELKKFQMDWGKKEDIQSYFRYKAVQSLSQGQLQSGENTEMTHEHHGISPIKDD